MIPMLFDDVEACRSSESSSKHYWQSIEELELHCHTYMDRIRSYKPTSLNAKESRHLAY